MTKQALLIVGNNDEVMEAKVKELSDACDGDKVIYDRDIVKEIRTNYQNVDEKYMAQYIAMKIDAEIESINLPGAQYRLLFVFIQNDDVVPLIKKRVTVLKLLDKTGYDFKRYKRMKADITISPTDNIVTAVARFLK